MKAYELQIGDWVCYDDDIEYSNPLKVDGLTTDDISIDGEGFLGGIDGTVRPINLTEDILEANGFEIGAYSTLKLDDNFWLEYYHHENRLRKLWKGIDEWENHTETLDVCFQCECYYVHEFQHALRLCGLDKLADNFKIG